jgi:hypothetical protein
MIPPFYDKIAANEASESVAYQLRISIAPRMALAFPPWNDWDPILIFLPIL